MKRVLLLALAAVLAFALFAVWYAPASWVWAQLDGELPIRADAVRGRALSGELVNPVFEGGPPLSHLGWHLQPAALLSGKLGVRVELRGEGLDASGDVRWGGGDTNLRQLNGRWDLEQAATALALPPLLGGLAQFALDPVNIGDDGLLSSAVGAIRFESVQTTLGGQLALGDFTATLEPGPLAIQALLRDEGGPVELDGRFELAQDGRYHASGRLGLREGAAKQLEQTFSLLGPRAADGRWSFDFSGILQSGG